MTDKYPLAALQGLRQLRQDKAMGQVRAWEKKLRQARDQVKRAMENHENFLEWLTQEEARRYQNIMETQMSLSEVDEFKTGLLGIRAMEADFLEQILKAEHHAETCETEVSRAKQALLEAQKGAMKIQVHKDKWMEAARLESERAAELEMEDFTPPAGGVAGHEQEHLAALG